MAAASRARPAEKAAEPTLEEVRQATERFRDVKVALAEGYIRDPNNLCETAPMMGQPASLGAMGIHYLRPDLLGITAPRSPRVNGDGTHTDFLKPSILIYEPQADGSLQLVAVENLVFAAAWRAAGHKEPPTFHGVKWDTMVDDPKTTVDEAHMFEPHFDRHVWLYRENPSGVFAPFNPAVSCAHHRGATVARVALSRVLASSSIAIGFPSHFACRAGAATRESPNAHPRVRFRPGSPRQRPLHHSTSGVR